MDKLLDLYSDFLISSFEQVTATGLSELVGGQISHDKITRELAGPKQTGREFWQVVKSLVRKMESAEGVLIIDDSIAEKPSSDENELICWHWDHSKSQAVKGINFITSLYHSQGVSLPVGYELVKKTEHYFDKKTQTMKRRSAISKNEYARALAEQAVKNQIPFGYVLADVWYASVENMRFVRRKLKKHFVLPLKSNRNVALSKQDQKGGRYVKLEDLVLEEHIPIQIWLEDLAFPVLLIKQIFTNEDDSTGVLYLVTSDLHLTYAEITAIYQKRWNIEPFHKSLKQNASLTKSPAHTPNTQTNHFFAAMCGYVKLEMLKVATHLNHFALRQRIYVHALQHAFEELQKLKPLKLAA
jgi:hypothetical protein